MLDIILSTDIKKKKRFKLESFSFVILASLSWEATLKTTKIELELTNVNMILFYEKAINKSYASLRRSK